MAELWSETSALESEAFLLVLGCSNLGKVTCFVMPTVCGTEVVSKNIFFIESMG